MHMCCMCVHCVCVSCMFVGAVCVWGGTMHMWMLKEASKWRQLPLEWREDSCKLPRCVSWEMNWDPLKEPRVF